MRRPLCESLAGISGDGTTRPYLPLRGTQKNTVLDNKSHYTRLVRAATLYLPRQKKKKPPLRRILSECPVRVRGRL